MNELLNKCKLALRITTDAYDDEIKDLIAAAEEDIAESGVVASGIEDKSLYNLAVVVFAKANFGSMNSDAEILHERYINYLKKMSVLMTHIGGDSE